MSSRLAIVIAGLTGLVSLSHEMLWFRVLGFVTGGSPASFGLVLGAFLLGLALGALAARLGCSEARSRSHAVLAAAGGCLLAATAGAFLLIPAVGWIVVRASWLFALIPVALVAGAFGAVLPLLSHFGISADHRAGEGLSHLYLSNILGSATGSLVTGLVLVDRLGLARVSATLAVLGLALAATLLVASARSNRARWPRAALAALALPVPLFTSGPAFDQIFEKLQLKREWNGVERFTDVVETKSGVITVRQDRRCFGGGVYDGVFSVDPVDDVNTILRAYALSALHPRPRRVLLVGLSTGSWAQVIVHHRDVEQLTVVEINRGYLDLIRSHPETQSLLTNPKLHVEIDDARRWLLAHPDQRFDVVVQNTTWHWRAHAVNLLSLEYHELVRLHLNPGGVFYYNTTGSVEAQRTACAAFPHGWRVVNMMAVSDRPFALDRQRMRRTLLDFEIDGRHVFDLARAEQRERFDQLVGFVDPKRPDAPADHWIEPCAAVLERTRGRPVVTDDNLVTESLRAWWRAP